MRTLLYLLFAAMSLVWPAAAQDIGKFAKVSPAGSWVTNNAVPTEVPEAGANIDTFYPMVDWQYKITSSNREFYGRYVETLNTPKGVEDNSTITLSFDPKFQTITLHHLHVIRDGKVIDRLELSEFDIYRVETDREKLIYNGDLQLAYVVPDVRPGDTLDYAFTRHGKNPATGPHFFLQFQQKYNDVTAVIHQSALVHDDVPVFTKPIQDAVEPKITRRGRSRLFAWELAGQVPTTADDNRPDWHYGFPVFQMGSYENWQDVGSYFSRHYKVPSPLPKNIQAVAAEISAAHNTPELRLRAALDRVQTDIRYLGIELGEGGYIPRRPERVLDRRYGDCKDMTLLLITLLKGLGIEAEPLLVDFDLKGGVSHWLPTHSAFDHIVVRAKVNDKIYILDPTKGPQMGALEHLQQGQFGKGVVVAFDSPGLIDADVPEPEYFEEFREEFDIVSDPDMISMTSTSIYYMHRADSMNGWFESNGLDVIEKSFLEFFQDNYPSIKQIGRMTIEADELAGKVTFLGNYQISNPWTVNKAKSRKTFTIPVREIDSEIPEFDGTTRKHPFKMEHPVRTKETLVMNLADNWDLDDDDVTIENDAFAYRKTGHLENNVYTEVYTIKSKTDHITSKAYAETMAEIETIDDELGIVLYVNVDGGSESDTDWGNLMVGAFSILWLSALLIGFGVFLGRKFRS